MCSSTSLILFNQLHGDLLLRAINDRRYELSVARHQPRTRPLHDSRNARWAAEEV
jgi:hypothetical protein